MPNPMALDIAVMTLPNQQWNENTGEQDTAAAIAALEQGKILYLPRLPFLLTAQESALLDPALLEPNRKNISYRPDGDRLDGVAVPEQRPAARQLLERYHRSCLALLASLLPAYPAACHSPAGTLRLHQIAEWRARASWRKDDSRLHVDAFPSRPNRGERILRIFTNINPFGISRTWRVGEPFPQLARRFLPRFKRYYPLASWWLNAVGITKTRRSRYDHLMLQLHDAMKSDPDYQRDGPQRTMDFPPGSTWICFSDQTPHAAMGGQFLLEQTFLLPVAAMRNPGLAPLNVLQSLVRAPLI
ncbi:Kdo hydroxylase family protein [Acerihabitans sp.]|uniref:Kdo hydroxylase family protein n=1 Tax=Acerihabitans sp. TaxID=2811394 RepID=UPI002ED85F9E